MKTATRAAIIVFCGALLAASAYWLTPDPEPRQEDLLVGGAWIAESPMQDGCSMRQEIRHHPDGTCTLIGTAVGPGGVPVEGRRFVVTETWQIRDQRITYWVKESSAPHIYPPGQISKYEIIEQTEDTLRLRNPEEGEIVLKRRR